MAHRDDDLPVHQLELLVRVGHEVATVWVGERVNVNSSEDVARASELMREECGTK